MAEPRVWRHYFAKFTVTDVKNVKISNEQSVRFRIEIARYKVNKLAIFLYTKQARSEVQRTKKINALELDLEPARDYKASTSTIQPFWLLEHLKLQCLPLSLIQGDKKSNFISE